MPLSGFELMTFQRVWQRSLLYRISRWYRDVWLQQPMRHTGLILLIALSIQVLGHGRHPIVPWPARWLQLVLGVWGISALFNSESWTVIRSSSTLMRWWTRVRSQGR